MELIHVRPVPPNSKAVRVHRSIIVGAWCFILIGSGHLSIMIAFSMREPEAPARNAFDAMHAATASLLGISRDMYAMYYGFSVLMALLGIGYGVLNLAVARLAPQGLQPQHHPAVDQPRDRDLLTEHRDPSLPHTSDCVAQRRGWRVRVGAGRRPASNRVKPGAPMNDSRVEGCRGR